MAERRNKHGETWDEAQTRIHASFPSTQGKASWVYKIDEDQLFRILGDVLEVGHPHTRRGHRPQPDLERDGAFLRNILDPEYSTKPFAEALRILAGERSLTHLANKTGMNRYRLHRLLNGTYQPAGAEMEMLARAFKKDPRYFREYRSVLIAATVMREMDDNPDRSAALARKISIPNGN